MTRIIIGIALAGALVLTLWLWFSASSHVPEVAIESWRDAESTRRGAEPSDALQAEANAHIESGGSTTRTPESPSANSEEHAHDLRVRVVDPAGEPVPEVALRLEPGPEAKDTPRFSSERFSRTTDAEGYARFPDVRPTLVASQAEPPGKQWRLVHDIAFENPPVVRLDRANLELPVIVSVIPFSGIVDVHVIDLDGRDAPDHSRVKLGLLHEEDLVSPLLPRDLKSWNAEARGGRASFPCVDLGRTWEVLASGPDSSVRSRTRGAGPVKSRGRARIEIVLGADHPVVMFRAVDEHRSPLGRVMLDIESNDLFGWGESSRRQTDEAGRFSVDTENGPGALRNLLVSYRADEHLVLRGRPRLDKPLQPGLNDGGDVVLSAEPILAEGIVQDSSGAAVPDAQICVGTDQRRIMTGFGDDSDVRGRSDARGHFELRGLVANGAFDLWAEKGALRSVKSRAREGQLGVILTLSPFHTVSGRWLVGPGIEQHRILTSFVDPQHSSLRAEVPKRSPDGSFTLAPIPAGVYDIAWSYDGVRLAELDKVDVSNDTDLGDIDLRDKLHRYEIVLLGARPSEKVRGEVAWRPSGSQEKWKNGNFEGNPIALVASTSPVDIWIRPNGYRCDVLFGVVGRVEVPLVAPLRVRLELRTTGELPRFPYILFADLEQDGLHVGQRTTSQSFTDDNRSLTYDVSAPGRMRVRWHLEWHSDSGSRGGNVLNRNDVEIQVADIPDEQVFPMDLDAKALTTLTSKPPW